MPRENESTPFRRVMSQTIMWLILGATVGAAALVNQSKQRAMSAPLGDPEQLRGISIRLPSHWENLDEDADGDQFIRRDPDFLRYLVVSYRQLGITDMFRLGAEPPEAGMGFVEEIDLGGQPARLMQQRGSAEPVRELTVSRRLPQAREVSISLIVRDTGRRSDISREVELIKRVAASVEIRGNPPQP
jgi:hypothetical protein